ncbi:TolC family protein [Myxococcaceae bacterium GXIMD 01537]
MVAALAAALLLAASPPPAVPLSFAEALDLAARAPVPRSAENAVAVKRAEDERLSGLVANPQFLVEPGYRVSPAAEGVDLRVGVAQGFNLSGQVRARGEAVRWEGAALSEEARALLLERRLAVAEAWLRLWAAEQAGAQTAREVELAEDFRRAVEGAAKLGAVTRLDAVEAGAHAAEARLAWLDAEGQVAEGWVVLARWVGHEPSRPLSASGSLPEVVLPPETEWPAWVARAARLPDAAARALGARAERARAEEVRASRGFHLSLGLSALREYDGATGAVVAAVLTPPLFERGARERGSLLASAARLEGEALDAVTAASAALALAFHEVAHSREVVEALRGRLLPDTEEAARLREVLFRAGDSTVLEVARARRLLAAVRARLSLALAEEARARVKARLLLDALATSSTPGTTTP